MVIFQRIEAIVARHQRLYFLFRFLATGGLNTVFGIAIYSFLVWIRIPPRMALLTGMLIAMVFNFVSYGKLAFGGKLRKENVPRFVGTYVVIYFVNSELLTLLIRFGLSKYAAFIVLVPFIVVTNFILLRYYVFRDRAPAPSSVNRS